MFTKFVVSTVVLFSVIGYASGQSFLRYFETPAVKPYHSRHIAVDGSILAATASSDTRKISDGMLLSTDGGTTWKRDLFRGSHVHLYIGTKTNKYVVLTECNGMSVIMKSTDGCKTWERFLEFDSIRTTGLFEPCVNNKSNEVFIGMAKGLLYFNAETEEIIRYYRSEYNYKLLCTDSLLVSPAGDYRSDIYYSTNAGEDWTFMTMSDHEHWSEPTVLTNDGAIIHHSYGYVVRYKTFDAVKDTIFANPEFYKYEMVYDDEQERVAILAPKSLYIVNTDGSDPKTIPLPEIEKYYGTSEYFRDLTYGGNNRFYIASIHGRLFVYDDASGEYTDLGKYDHDGECVKFGQLNDKSLVLYMFGSVFRTADHGVTFDTLAYGWNYLPAQSGIGSNGEIVYFTPDSILVDDGTTMIQRHQGRLFSRQYRNHNVSKDYPFSAIWPVGMGYTFMGILESFDNFATWDTLKLEIGNVYDIDYSPKNDVLLVTDNFKSAKEDAVLYKYQRDMKSWKRITPGLISDDVLRIEVDKYETIFLLKEKMLYWTADTGMTWIPMLDDTLHHFESHLWSMNHKQDMVLYDKLNGYWMVYNAGSGTWTNFNDDLTCKSIGTIILTDDGWLYAAGEKHIYKSSIQIVPTSRLSAAPPASFTLSQSYPNPVHASGTVTIPYELPRGGDAVLTVYDIHGRVVERREVSGAVPGSHSATVHLSGHPAGVYMYTLSVGGTVETRKMVVVR